MTNIDELVGERDDGTVSVLWVVVGVFLLGMANGTVVPLGRGGPIGLALLALIAAAVSTVVDSRRMSRPAGLWVALLFGVMGLYNFVGVQPMFFASDVSLFESWASHLLLAGENPMAANMLEARDAWNISNQSANVTALEGGGVVSSYSYPGGTLWISSLEAAVSPWNRLGLSTLLASTMFLTWLIHRVDVALVPVAVLVWMLPVARTLSAGMGMITPLWLFPLGVGLAAWYDGRLWTAALGLGLAAGSKQLAWPIAGLVVIHVVRTQGRRVGGRVAAGVAGVALALTAPFWLWDTSAWLHSMFFSLGESSVVRQGIGLTTLSTAGIVTIPKTVHSLLTAGVGLSFVAATWRWPDQMQWLIPFGMIATLIVHYRTLPSYYAATVPLAVISLDARLRSRSGGLPT